MPEPSTASGRTDVGRGGTPAGSSRTRGAVTRYDRILARIPAAFLVGGVAAHVAGLPLRVALPAATTVAALAVVDGLFRNPPRRPGVGDGVA